MPHYEKQAITATIATTSVTVFSRVVNGDIVAIVYDGGYTDETVDIAVTSEDTGVEILTMASIGASAVTFMPKMAGHAAADGAAITAAQMENSPPVAGERVKLVLSSGTDTESAVFTIIVAGTISPDV